MRRALAIALGAVVVAGTGIALAPRLLTSRITPPPPPLRKAVPAVTARPLTSVSVPVTLPIRAIADLANAKGPGALSGTSALPALRESTETTIAWTLSRSTVSATGEGGHIVLTTAFAGGASLRGRTRPGRTARGGPGRTLPRAFNESIDVAADLRVTAEPRLTPAWRVEPGFQAKASLRQSEAMIADLFKLDLRSALQPRIEASLKQELDAIGARLASHPFLENAARETWDRLCTSLEVKSGESRPGEAPSSLWLDIEPKGWRAGPLLVEAESVTVPLSAHASVTLSDSPRAQAECEPFPERLALTEAVGGAGRDDRITLGAALDLAALSEAATAGIARDRLLSTNGVTVELDTLGLTAHGDAILVAIDGRFRKPGLFGASAVGRLYFLTQPALDPGAAALRLGEAVIEPASAEALAQVAGGDFSALAPEIARWLGALQFDLRPQLDQLRAAASAAAEGLRQPDRPLGITGVTLAEIRLVGLHPAAQGLRLRAEADGSLTLRPVVLTP